LVFKIFPLLSDIVLLNGLNFFFYLNNAYINDPANINKTTPLMYAIMHNRIAVAEYLLQKGAKIHDNSWNTHILYEAVSNNNIDMVKMLLSYKTQALVDISPDTEPKNKPLHKAIVANNLAIVKLLVENGADLSKEDYVAFAKSYSWTDKNLIEYLQSKSKK
ncbi:MAG: ankyrin repeat domain-containing protein, partial [Thermonemataceae bacterium]|nr:ankyrin repeat domain-containing protein [Thermonemataceae bacterium]